MELGADGDILLSPQYLGSDAQVSASKKEADRPLPRTKIHGASGAEYTHERLDTPLKLNWTDQMDEENSNEYFQPMRWPKAW